jgi:uncharacterized protein
VNSLRYFVDTSFLVARFHEDDDRHADAMAFLDEVMASPGTRPRLILHDYVFDEMVTTLRSHSRSHQVAVAAGEAIWRSRTTELLPVNRPTMEAAWKLFVDRPDRLWSFTDCVSFVVMGQQGLREALSFDENFKQAGFITRP